MPAERNSDVRLADIPAETPISEDAALTCYDPVRRAFVTWEEWRIATPFGREESTAPPEPPRNAIKAIGRCSATGIELRWKGRWYMYAFRNKNFELRRDFASPFLGHAQRTAELWYGPVANGGWQYVIARKQA